MESELINRLVKCGILMPFEEYNLETYLDTGENGNCELVYAGNKVYYLDEDGTPEELTENTPQKQLYSFLHKNAINNCRFCICPANSRYILRDLYDGCTAEKCKNSYISFGPDSWFCEHKACEFLKKIRDDETARKQYASRLMANTQTEKKASMDGYFSLCKYVDWALDIFKSHKQNLADLVNVCLKKTESEIFLTLLFENGKPVSITRSQNPLRPLIPHINDPSFEFSYVTCESEIAEDAVLLIMTALRLPTGYSNVHPSSNFFLREKKLKNYMLDNYGMTASETNAFLKENSEIETLELDDGTVVYLKHAIKNALASTNLSRYGR